ncbi:ras guanine nucleotide exchange factor domain-containing protein, partial [Mycena pura]
MASFRVFTSAEELLDLLVRRFWIQPSPPPGLAPAEHEAWVACTQQGVQRSVLHAFGCILQLDDMSPTDSLCILERMKDFIAAAHVAGPEAHHLQSLIEHAVNAVDLPSEDDSEALREAVTDKMQLREIEPLELARQLTIMENGLFRRIRLADCVQRATEHSAENSDNFTRFVSTNIKIPLWVAQSILNEDRSQRRAKVVKYWIAVADRCRALNNFSTMAAIHAALSAPFISRLKRTWTHVSQRYMGMLAACARIMDSGKSFRNYRRVALAAAVPPGVPFMGILLSSLQFIHDGTPDYVCYIPGPNGNSVPVLGTPLVNFNKWRKVCEFMDDSVKPWQKPFNLHVLPPVQAYIEDALGTVNPSQEFDEGLWNMSLLREPGPRDWLETSGVEKA